jgi:hypothetical protein
MPDYVPPQPSHSEVRQAEQADRKRYAKEQERLRKREQEDREKALIAESRRRAAETSQSK